MVTLFLFLVLSHACDLLTNTDFTIDSTLQSNSTTCWRYADLKSALIEAQGLLQVRIVVKEAAEAKESLAEWKFEKGNTTIEGNGNTLVVGGVEVTSGAVVTLGHFSLVLKESALRGIHVRGKLVVNYCDVSGWNEVVIEAEDGEVTVENSCFRSNEGRLIRMVGGKQGLRLTNTGFVGNSDGIFEFHPSTIGSATVSISIENCTFDRNRGNIDLFQLTTRELQANTPLTFSVTNSEFLNNDAVLFNLRLTLGSLFSIDHCVFRGNFKDGLRVTLDFALGTIHGSEWRGNRGSLLTSDSLAGRVLVSNCSISEQSQIAAIQIDNSRSASQCQISISNTVIFDSIILPIENSAAAVYSVQCTLYIEKSEIRNCTALSPVLSSAYGAVVGIQSVFHINFTELSLSGGSGAAMLLLLSAVSTDHVVFRRSVIGADGVLLLVGCSGVIKSTTFFEAQFSTVLFRRNKRLVFLFLEMSNVAIDGLTVEDNKIYIVSVVSSFYSTITANEVSFRNITGNSMFAMIGSSLLAEKLAVTDCFYNLLLESGYSKSVFSNTNLTSSHFRFGVLTSGTRGDIRIDTVQLKEITSPYLVSAQFSTVIMTSVLVSNCLLEYLLKDLIRSSAQISGIEYDRSPYGVIMCISGSTVSVSASKFVGLNAVNKHVFQVSDSYISIEKTIFESIIAKKIAIISRNSVLNISNTYISDVKSLSDSLISIDGGSLIVMQSMFRNFNATLFDCDFSLISISSSVVQSGGFAELSENQALKGGFLRCIDCNSITISETNFDFVSADIGGAVYVISSSNSAVLTISFSKFSFCTAKIGGAVYVESSTMWFSNLIFLHSTAIFSGGGLFAQIPSAQQIVLFENITFVNNTANEGGGMKWSKSVPVSLTSIRFSNNSAAYGADIASYGIGILSEEIRTLTPGQPTVLTFSLVDHYGQTVVSASYQWLTLVPTANVTFVGVSSKVIVAGIYQFESIEIQTRPDSDQKLIAIYEDNKSHFSLIHTQTVSFRQCVPGELRKNDSCTVCLPGYFSFDPSDDSCTLCPTTAVCPGGKEIHPLPGHWLTNVTSDPVVSCMISGVCKGTINNTCERGYDGELCSRCGEGWSRVDFWACGECQHAAITSFELVFVAVYIGLILIGVGKYALWNPNIEKLHIVKTIVRHLFGLSLISFARVNYPLPLQVFLRVVLDCASIMSATFPAQCVGWDFTLNLIIAIFLGAILMGFAAAILAFRCVKCRSISRFRSDLSVLGIFVCTLLPNCGVLTALPSFVCVPAGGETQLLVIDMSKVCWESPHFDLISTMIVPGIFLNIAVPIVMLTSKCSNSGLTKLTTDYTTWKWQPVMIISALISAMSVILPMSFSLASQAFIGLLQLYTATIVYSAVAILPQGRDLFLTQASNFLQIACYSLVLSFTEYTSDVWRSLVSVAIIVPNSVFLFVCLCRLAVNSNKYRQEVYRISLGQPRNISELGLVPPNSSLRSLRDVSINLSLSK